MNQTRVILHCGAHKTGTTTIQKSLFNLKPDLREKGIRYIEPARFNERDFLKFLYDADTGNDEEKRQEDFAEFFTSRSKPRDVDTLLISHESILGFSQMLPPVDGRTFYGDRRYALPRLARLKDIFREVQVIYYVRRQDHFLESVYLENLRQGYFTGDFSQYVATGIGQSIRWMELLDDLVEVFGSASVAVRPFEEVKMGGPEFVRRFLSCFSDHDNWKIVDDRHDNPSLSAVGYLVATRCYEELDLDQRRTMSRLLRRHFPPETSGKAVLFEDQDRAEFLRRFKRDNSDLCARYFPEWTPFYLGEGTAPI